MPFALFGIDDGSLNLAVNLLILFLVVVWFALIYWTYADARRRIGDPVLVMTATVASLFPFVGTIVYSILRPPEFLEDVHERELEVKAAELRLRHLTESSCPRCEHPIERNWLRCPECQTRLKNPCRSCGRAVDPRWSICPHCEAPVAGDRAGAARRPSRAARQQAGQRRPEQRQGERPRAAQAPPERGPQPEQQEGTRRAPQPSRGASPRQAPRQGAQRPAEEGRTARRPTKT